MKENLYHIHKVNNKDEIWKVGNELEIGKENNNFINVSFGFESRILVDDERYPFLTVFNYYKNQNDIENQIKLLNTANCFINEYQILIRELGMEEVRKELFPQLPSRQKCIWLCRKNQLSYWKKFIDGETEIFEVETLDSFFKTRNSLIPLPSDSYNTILNKAQLYWNGNNNIENEDDEYLYVGKLKNVNKFDE